MRKCERCGGRMQPFVARKTVDGQKVCEGCASTPMTGRTRRSAGIKNLAALGNPIAGKTGKHPEEWYHGSPHDFEGFGDPADHQDPEMEEHTDRYKHWNTLVGNHFTSDHRVARDFSGGEHSHSDDLPEDYEGPMGHVVHVKLHMKNPKVYASEHDMDQDVYEHEWESGNHHDKHISPPPEDDDEYEDWAEEHGHRRHYAGDSQHKYSKDEPDPNYAYGFHPKATGWLNTHPDKEGIVRRYKDRMKQAGYDGVVYGNEYEQSAHGKDATSAISFEPHQIEITQHHYGKQDCLSEIEAKRRTPGPGQLTLPGLEDVRRRLPAERPIDTSRPWPTTWTPSFFNNKQAARASQSHDTGRLWAPLPQECWDRYYGRHTGAQRRRVVRKVTSGKTAAQSREEWLAHVQKVREERAKRRAQPSGTSQDDIFSMFSTPIPEEELKAQRERAKPKPERISDRTYSLDDVSRKYGWEGFGEHEISHLVHQPAKAMFSHEDVPVHSLRLTGEDGRLKPAKTHQEIADQGEDEQERLQGLTHGYDRGDAIPPIVVVRHGEHHIIADGSHRAAIAAERGDTHIPAFVTERTKFGKTARLDHSDRTFWHGSATGNLRGGTYGLHVGTRDAAHQALTAAIGHPVDGHWDGTREYGKTLLAGKHTLRERGITPTGYNYLHAPEQDHYPTGDAGFQATNSKIPMDAKPDIFPVRITGEMSNDMTTPHEDFKANGYMKAQLKRGRARRGYFYTNQGEDSGSISAVVPNGDHLERMPTGKTAARSIDYSDFTEGQRTVFDAHHQGKNVGYVTTDDKDDHVWLDEVYVHPDYRGSGIARDLMDRALSHHDGREVRLKPDSYSAQGEAAGVPTDALRRWYGGYGFTPNGEHMVRKTSALGEESARHDAGQQDVYAVRSGNSMVNLCGYHRDVHVGNASAADALGDQLGLGGRERSAESLGEARKGSCAACNRDTSYQLKLLTPRWMQNARSDRQRKDKPMRTRPLPTLKQSENAKGQHWCAACGEHHEDSWEPEEHAATQTDWDKHYPTFHEIHRGIGVHLPQDLHDRLHADDDDLEEEGDGRGMVMHDLVHHLNTQPGGMHWTADHAKAWQFAHDYGGGSPFSENRFKQHDTPLTHLVITGEKPAREDIETDARRLAEDDEHEGVSSFDESGGEKEVPLKRGTKVRVSSIHWRLGEHSRGPKDTASRSYSLSDDDEVAGPRYVTAGLKTLAEWEQGELFKTKPGSPPPSPKAEWHQRMIDKYSEPEADPDDEAKDCDECGEEHSANDGHRECRSCGERHQDHETTEDHETGYTDWDQHYDNVGDEIHRGMPIRLPHWDRIQMHGASNKGSSLSHEEQAKVLMGHIKDRNLGMHWTDHRPAADEFTTRTAGHDDTQVIVHARKPDREHIETDWRNLKHGQVFGYDDHEEAEVPLQDGAPVHITGISWRPRTYGSGHGTYPINDWIRHDFDKPHPHTAARTASWDDDDEDEPDECEHCGEDKNSEDHAEVHHEWIRDQKWHTDWSEDREVGAHNNGEIQRGMAISLPKHVHDVVHDEDRPLEERGKALAEHVIKSANDSGHLGRFWTDEDEVAQRYAAGSRIRAGSKDDNKTPATPVTLHVKFPGYHHIETDPDELEHHGVYSYHIENNREVPLQHGTPLEAAGVSWAHHTYGDDGPRHWDSENADWKRHTFKEPIKAMSSKKPLPTLRTLAHDATENEAIRHCPFCGAGKIIGRADGTVECEFCHHYFTVQVQPQYPNFPQTIDGMPQQIPGMPGQVETPGGAPGMDAGMPPDQMGQDGGGGPPWAQEDGEGFPDDDTEGKEAEEDEEEPPPFAKQSSLPVFRTTAGARLIEDDYVRHLAIRFAPDRSAMIARIREERGAR